MSMVNKVILISIPKVEAWKCSVFQGDNTNRNICNIKVVLLKPLDNARVASTMVFETVLVMP